MCLPSLPYFLHFLGRHCMFIIPSELWKQTMGIFPGIVFSQSPHSPKFIGTMTEVVLNLEIKLKITDTFITTLSIGNKVSPC